MMVRLVIIALSTFLLIVAVTFTGCAADGNGQAKVESPTAGAPESGMSEADTAYERSRELEDVREGAYEEGYEAGYEEGYRRGQDEAHQQGYDEGYDEAYYVGFDEGCVALGDRLIEIGVLDWYQCPSP